MRKNPVLFLGITLGLTCVTFFILLRQMPFKDMKNALLQANGAFLWLGLGMMLLYVAGEGICIRVTMNSMGERHSIFRCIGYAFVGFYFSGITPSASGGQPAQIYYMTRNKCGLSRSMLTLLLISSVYQISMLLYGVFMYAVEYHFLEQSVVQIKWLLFLSGTINFICVGLLLFALFSPELLRKLAHAFLKKLRQFKLCKEITGLQEKTDKLFAEYAVGAEYIKKNPWLICKLFLITTVRLTLLYLIPFFVYLSFGLQGHTALQMVAMQSILTVAVSALPLPGSIGVSEGVFLLLFGMLFSRGFLLPAMLLTRGISFYAVLLLSGGIFSFSSGVSLCKRRECNC